jgi:serine/threonine protein kinase/Tol biopolymer transport system component
MHLTCPDCGYTVERVEGPTPDALRCPECGSTLRPGSEKTGPWVAAESLPKAGPVEVGQTISHYQILDRLGGGGMGVVYQARDARLGRLVALKFLSEGHAEDRQALERFRREACTASELNHPHICTVFDIGEHGGQPFLVMELLEGQTLKHRMAAKPLPTDELLELGIQIADALDAAHTHGIVHRDVKPANLFVTRRGQAKVLDFGLAKLMAGHQPAGAAPQPLTEDEAGPLSSPGTVLGTVAYMSPEQARGQELDARTDLFSFGVVLYEMATGRRPFQGKTSAVLFDAILNQTPPSPRHWNPSLPVELEQIIQKALEKDREVRCQTAAELRADLKRLRRDLDSGRVRALTSTATAMSPARSSRPRRPWVWLAGAALLALVIGGGVWLHSNRPAGTSPAAPSDPPAEPAPLPLRVVPFTSLPGLETGPTFSPDGSRIAFSWDENKPGTSHIYVKLVRGDAELLQLTKGPGEDMQPAWSPDNSQIAFLRKREDKVSLCTVPAQPGPEQVQVDDLGIGLLDNPDLISWSLSWSPKGDTLAFPYRKSPSDAAKICLFSLADRKIQAELTSPPRATCVGDGGPSISPDGKWLAFLRTTSWAVQDLYVVPMTGGEPKRLTDEPQLIVGCAWTPDSREIVLASHRTGYSGLWRIPFMGGQLQPLVGVSRNAYAPAVSLRESRLAYVEATYQVGIWRVNLSGPTQERPATKLISSTRWDGSQDYSPDGKKIVFASNRDGRFQIWVCDSEGLNPRRLTDGMDCGLPRWSPDGQEIAYNDQRGRGNVIYLVAAHGGPPRPLTPTTLDCGGPTWSRDGEWVYFSSMQNGWTTQLWKIRTRGGAPVQVTWHSGELADESKDGQSFYYYRDFPAPSVWKAPVLGGEEALPALGARIAGLTGSPMGHAPLLEISTLMASQGSKVLELPKGSDWSSWTFAETGTEQGIYFGFFGLSSG